MRTAHVPHAPYLRLLPASGAGRVAVWALLAFGVLLGGFVALVASGQDGGETLLSNLLLTVPALGAAAAGFLAAGAGAFAVLRRRDRALLVLLALAVGGLVVFFVVGEALTPH